MKALVVILLLYSIYCVAEDRKSVLNKFPKKVSPGLKLFLNSIKYLKNGPFTSKKSYIDKNYTVFLPVLPNKVINVPDSPYFQYEPNEVQKPRVKKVLQQYSYNRKKRSADDKGISLQGAENLKADKVYDEVESRKHKNGNRHVKADKNVNSDKENKTHKKLKHVKYGSKGKEQEHKKAVKLNHRNKTHRHRNDKGNKRKSKKMNKKDVPKNSAKDSRRLITGKEALIEEYPYVVSIQKNKEHWCTGSLLNPRLVITTANCLWKASQISRLRVRVGSRYVDRGGEMAEIQEVMKHPQWGIRRNPDNDVALMLLDRNVRFSDSVHAVDLPNRVMMPVFDDAWVTSWGADRRDGVYDKRTLTLQVYHARLIPRDKCNNVTQRFGVVVSENFVCLAQTGKRAPCTRDTGAPAVSDGVLWGLASWGIRKLCGTERFPAMFSYLASHSNMDFITNATHVLMADQRHYPLLDRFPRMRTNSTK